MLPVPVYGAGEPLMSPQQHYLAVRSAVEHDWPPRGVLVGDVAAVGWPIDVCGEADAVSHGDEVVLAYRVRVCVRLVDKSRVKHADVVVVVDRLKSKMRNLSDFARIKSRRFFGANVRACPLIMMAFEERRRKKEKPMWWIEERRCGPPHRLGKETRVGQK